MRGIRAGVETCVVVGVGVKQLLRLVGVPPASSSLLSKRGFWQRLRRAEDQTIELAGCELLNVAMFFFERVD